MKIFSLFIILIVLFGIISSMFFMLNIAINNSKSNVKIIENFIASINATNHQSSIACSTAKVNTQGQVLCVAK